ncbi:MAG: bifunctional 3,4-dihydroxy-2-butanone-4-phosphate synthase/GTP cyclohydrolase II [Gammaproteobacteria bacterium]|nr:bifunctional 3,4-dihydroxy-2-butanone-4-phosphate synthase/GTP cyclohydrolase II [Gammaproteobacteria bacterium]
MNIINIKEAINEINNGKMIILVDDEKRENEGDLVIAAEKITPEHVNFMSKYGRGLICLAMDRKIINRLNLPPMSALNQSKFKTNFTVSIEAKHGITTGISAFDRTTTILTAINENVTSNDIVSPGHVFPLCSQDFGVLARAGQTEGSVDLARLANCKPAAVICEIMNDDGTMSRMEDLELFSRCHGIKIVQIKDLIKYRLRHDKSIVKKTSETSFPTAFGEFMLHAYESTHDRQTHLALVKGTICPNHSILVRVHSECLSGDVFASRRCDCGEQLHQAMQMIQEIGSGVILYLRQEGRGIGLANKLKAYSLQDKGFDTVEANHKLGFSEDLRDYGIGAQILSDLGISKIKLLTNNPKKIAAFDGFGMEVVTRIPLEINSNPHNIHYLKTKKVRLNHLLTI